MNEKKYSIPESADSILFSDEEFCVALLVLIRNVPNLFVFDLYTFEIYMEYTLMSYLISRILYLGDFYIYLFLFPRMMFTMLDKQFLFFICFLYIVFFFCLVCSNYCTFRPMILYMEHFVIVYTHLWICCFHSDLVKFTCL